MFRKIAILTVTLMALACGSVGEETDEGVIIVPEPTSSPEPTETVEPSPSPSVEPSPSATVEPSSSPEPTDAPEPTPVPTPECMPGGNTCPGERPLCHPEYNVCVQCTTDAECGSGQYCDSEILECRFPERVEGFSVSLSWRGSQSKDFDLRLSCTDDEPVSAARQMIECREERLPRCDGVSDTIGCHRAVAQECRDEAGTWDWGWGDESLVEDDPVVGSDATGQDVVNTETILYNQPFTAAYEVSVLYFGGIGSAPLTVTVKCNGWTVSYEQTMISEGQQWLVATVEWNAESETCVLTELGSMTEPSSAE